MRIISAISILLSLFQKQKSRQKGHRSRSNYCSDFIFGETSFIMADKIQNILIHLIQSIGIWWLTAHNVIIDNRISLIIKYKIIQNRSHSHCSIVFTCTIISVTRILDEFIVDNNSHV